MLEKTKKINIKSPNAIKTNGKPLFWGQGLSWSLQTERSCQPAAAHRGLPFGAQWRSTVYMIVGRGAPQGLKNVGFPLVLNDVW